jgi:hypothetical protein
MDPEEYLLHFLQIYEDPPRVQPPIGHTPAAYILSAYAQCPHDHALANAASEIIHGNYTDAMGPVDRNFVQKICANNNIDPIVAYCFVMAWGAQWSASSYDNFVKNIEQINDLRTNLYFLRNPQLLPGAFGMTEREKAFDLFCNGSPIEGLGISYYTKVIFFFLHGANGSRGYIVDKWTSLSISRLYAVIPNPGPVPLNAASAPAWAAPHYYESFCGFIDFIAVQMGADWTGSDVELAFFGSPDENNSGFQWREMLTNRQL